MGALQDLTGQKLGKLTVIEYIKGSKWKCICDCGNVTVVPTRDLNSGKTRSCGCARKKYNLNENYFDNIDTEEKAYILGFIASDGSVAVEPYNIKIDIKKDDNDILYKIKNAMNYNFELKEYKQKSSIDNKEYVIDISRLNITNKHIVLKMIDYGIVPNKTEFLNFNFSCMDSNLIRHFIRGYFDGDGSISMDKDNRIMVSITSNKNTINKFIEIFNKIIDNYNPHIYVRNKENQNCVTLMFTKNIEKYIFIKFLYDNSNIYMNRKFKQYQKALYILEKTQTTK